MDAADPFRPPRAKLEDAPGADLGPPWRIEGTTLIVRNRAKLPDICVRTGEPAKQRASRELSWTPLWFRVLAVMGTLIALLTYSTIRRTGTIDFAMSDATARRSRRGKIVALLAFVATVVLWVIATDPAARLGILLLGATALTVALLWARPFRILKIDRFHMRLRLTPQAAQAFAAEAVRPSPSGS